MSDPTAEFNRELTALEGELKRLETEYTGYFAGSTTGGLVGFGAGFPLESPTLRGSFPCCTPTFTSPGTTSVMMYVPSGCTTANATSLLADRNRTVPDDSFSPL